MSRKSAQSTQLAHSLAKVDFYITFLERYLRMLLRMGDQVQEIHIYDVFCGRAEYKNGYFGSAIRSYNLINDLLWEMGTKTKVVLHLNDLNPKHYKSVQLYVQKHPGVCLTECLNQNAGELMSEVVERCLRNTYHTRTVLFVDPYGYKAVSPTILKKLVEVFADVMLFLPISFMYRFRQYAFRRNANKGALTLRKWILEFLPENHPICREEEMDVLQYIEYLTDAFQFGKYWATSYHIERDTHNYFSLFFLSRSPMGFEKALEAKWKLDEENGCGFQLPVSQMNLFEAEWKKERIAEQYECLRMYLIGLLSTQGKANNIELYHFVLRRGFLPQHAKLVLLQMQENEEIECVKLETGEVVKAKVFYIGYSFSRQREKMIIKYKGPCDPVINTTEL